MVGRVPSLTSTSPLHAILGASTSNTTGRWSIHKYIIDAPVTNPSPALGLPVPRKTNYESLAYLTYIIDNYDTLPSYMAFVQGPERQWHQQAPLATKIRALNLTSLEREQYISFRCESNMGCERRPYIDVGAGGNFPGHTHLAAFWTHLLPDEPAPAYISGKCCGQFAVTRAAVQRLPLAAWQRIRAPLLRDVPDLVATEPWARDADWELDADQLNLWYERFWHIWFGMGHEHCPSTETCQQEHFSNAIVCAGDMNSVPWEGNDTWVDNACKTAFDGLPAGTEPNWAKWHMAILGVAIDLRLERAQIQRARTNGLEEWKKMVAEKFEKEAAERKKANGGVEPAIPQIAAPDPSSDEAIQKAKSKNSAKKKLGPGIKVDW